MNGFEKIDENTLVNFDLQLVIEDGGLDFELGGTRFVNLFHDPELTRTNVLKDVQWDIEEIKKSSSNPQVIASILASNRKSIFRSEKRQQIWQLALYSRESDRVFEWVLGIDSSRRKELIRKIKDALPNVENAEETSQHILNSLGGLSCWQQVNRKNFDSIRIALSNEGDPEVETKGPKCQTIVFEVGLGDSPAFRAGR